MAAHSSTIRLIDADGSPAEGELAEEYRPYIDSLDEGLSLQLYRDMALMRRCDAEATALARQGKLALWAPSIGQEGAQVGSGHAARVQDYIFPTYREHIVGRIRGVELDEILALFRGAVHGGWDPRVSRFHLYTLVIGSHTLHATGYALGAQLDGNVGTGEADRDEAVLVYFGDGASAQGDVNEALVFAASYRTPQVFFLQNNQWAISVPVSTQSPVPLYQRAHGFGLPGVQLDGNDVLASYAVTAKHLDDARSGAGPSLIEALTYRVGPHTTTDDPTKYRTAEEMESWQRRDPIERYRRYLQGRGASEALFAEVAEWAEQEAVELRRRVLAQPDPVPADMFDHVYSDPHPLMAEQKRWLADYEAQFGAGEERAQ